MSYAENNRKDFAHISDNVKHAIAGAGAGMISAIVTCPLDVVKTRLQNQSVGVMEYSGTVGTMKRIRMEEGLRGLYRGLTPTVVGYLPTWAIYFTIYDSCKKSWGNNLTADHKNKNDWRVHIASAMTAGLITTSLTSPIWVIKTRFMSQSKRSILRYNSIFEAMSTIVRNEGVKGFYKGLGPSLIGVSHVAIQFPLYEYLKCLSADADMQSDTTNILMASVISKMIASTATYPHEVIRTRLQNQLVKPFKYNGVLHTAKVILFEEGFRGFYKGMSTNLIRTVPSSAITILTYELIVKKLDQLKE